MQSDEIHDRLLLFFWCICEHEHKTQEKKPTTGQFCTTTDLQVEVITEPRDDICV